MRAADRVSPCSQRFTAIRVERRRIGCFELDGVPGIRDRLLGVDPRGEFSLLFSVLVRFRLSTAGLASAAAITSCSGFRSISFFA